MYEWPLKKIFSFGKKSKTIGAVVLLLFIIWLFSLPSQFFSDPYSTVLTDKENNLLSASIAKDGQWRFPQSDSIPEKFKKAIITFEDQYFYTHIGFNPFSIGRALYQNIKAGKVVSGGSTLSMQVIRLSRKGKSRTYLEKLLEIFLATRMELTYSKNEILNLYTSHAPFGGNIVGLKAASWRYFGRKAYELSWAEAAMLAVLPNRPGLIFPGKSHQVLKKKRDRLLKKMFQQSIFDSLTYELALTEPLPSKPKKLPSIATHLLTRNLNEGKEGKYIQTTLDYYLQQHVQNIIYNHKPQLKANEIYNIAALVLDVSTGNTLAYIGNTDPTTHHVHGMDVDIITSERSTGSTLKPILYASMINEGLMLPKTLLPDVPIFLKGFAPKNYSKTFDGAVPADIALARSLNIPAVKMLQEYSVHKFYHKLKSLGMTSLEKHADHYGLSLILGGSETSLWDLTGIYAGMARTLNNYYKYNDPYRYSSDEYRSPNFLLNQSYNKNMIGNMKEGVLSAAAIFEAFEAMLKVYRPGAEKKWELFETSQKIAWKTGTSFGHRDAWAVGLTPKHVVGVWVGNASGEGRPGMTGVSMAAPILFDIFNLLPSGGWFEPPYDELQETIICSKSGHIARDICEPKDTLLLPEIGSRSLACPYHKMVHLDNSREFQVHSDCESVNNMVHEARFLLPPVQEWYYKAHNPDYEPLPPYKKECLSSSNNVSVMQIIYPGPKAKIYVPKEIDGVLGESVFEVAHRNLDAKIFWHIDNEYIGYTKRIHQLNIQPIEGMHTLTLVDENGESISRDFEVITE